MSEELNRREFVKGSAVVSAGALLGLSLEEKALAAHRLEKSKKVSNSSVKDMPVGKIGSLKVSRLICGGNLISGHAHSRDLLYVSSLLRHYFTDEKVMETFRVCEENGINSAVLRLDDHVIRIINKYWKDFGNPKNLSHCYIRGYKWWRRGDSKEHSGVVKPDIHDT